MTTNLIITDASAGAGKTYDLTKQISQAILEGVDPARILATTFTKKAAAELKKRVYERLVKCEEIPVQDRLQKVQRLELSLIGTVHGVANIFLKRFALRLGLSPDLTVIDEKSCPQILNRLLFEGGLVALHEDLVKCAACFELGPIIDTTIVELLAEKRSNQIDDESFRNQMAENAEAYCSLFSEAVFGEVDFSRLYQLVEASYAKIDKKVKQEQKTADLTKKCLDKLRQTIANPAHQWVNFVKMAKLKAGKGKGGSGSDALLDELRDYAGTFKHAKNFHKDLQDLYRCFTETVIAIEKSYERFKADRGLLDYTDLEVLFLRMLDTQELRQEIQEEFDRVYVDEFQDTSPIQLAIFNHLMTLADSTYWVGDPKQAIYGFRGTDPQLIQKAWQSHSGARRNRLEKNYRSKEGLVLLTGKLFEPVLGETAVQEPVRIEPGEVERWLIEGKLKKEGVHKTIALGISQLAEEGTPLRDIAVLARGNENAKGLASALKEIGIPVRLEVAGLFKTQEGVMVLAGLALVADSNDSLATATVYHLLAHPEESTPKWLERRLASLVAGLQNEAENRALDFDEWATEPIFQAIRQMDAKTLSPSVLVETLFNALEMERQIHRWGDVETRSANLDAMVALAVDYENRMLESGQAATLTGLIAHWKELASKKDDMSTGSSQLDSVTISTYHSAKGLQWRGCHSYRIG